MLKKLSITVVLIVSFMLTFPVFAQSVAEELKLNLSKDFGFSSGTGKIQGTFSLRANGPDDLIRVEFLIDNQPVFDDTEKPFRFQFNTDSYELGIHTLTAVGYTGGDDELSGRTFTVEFVAAEEGGQFVIKILVPLFAVIIGFSVLSFVIPTVMGKNKTSSVPPGTQQNYGILGGTICPKCQRPYPINLFGINLGIGRLDRCRHCGKWSIVRRYPLASLREAENAELENMNESSEENSHSESEKLEKALENSRYEDV